MKDALLILCVGAVFLAGFPLMKRLDRWLNGHVAPPEDAPGEDAPQGSGNLEKRDGTR